MKSFAKLISSLKRLPGIGPKQAERLAIFFLRAPDFEAENLIAALREARAGIRPCSQCFNFTDGGLCALCRDDSRDRGLLCVVSEPQDVAALERSRGFKGLYHVLHGALSPLDGIGPESLRIRELLERVASSKGALREVVLATDPDAEGEATALYLSQRLKEAGPIKITRIAHGVPMGGDLDYIDERTLSHALTGRTEV